MASTSFGLNHALLNSNLKNVPFSLLCFSHISILASEWDRIPTTNSSFNFNYRSRFQTGLTNAFQPLRNRIVICKYIGSVSTHNKLTWFSEYGLYWIIPNTWSISLWTCYILTIIIIYRRSICTPTTSCPASQTKSKGCIATTMSIPHNIVL